MQTQDDDLPETLLCHAHPETYRPTCLKQPLERVEGVSQVALYGVEQKQIEIRINADKLSASGISVQTLQRRLGQENFVISAGSLRSANQVLQVSPKGEFLDLDQPPVPFNTMWKIFMTETWRESRSSV